MANVCVPCDSQRVCRKDRLEDDKHLTGWTSLPQGLRTEVVYKSQALWQVAMVQKENQTGLGTAPQPQDVRNLKPVPARATLGRALCLKDWVQ